MRIYIPKTFQLSIIDTFVMTRNNGGSSTLTTLFMTDLFFSILCSFVDSQVLKLRFLSYVILSYKLLKFEVIIYLYYCLKYEFKKPYKKYFILFNIAFIMAMPTQHLVRFGMKLLNRNSNMCVDKIIVSMFRNTQCTCIFTV